MVRLSEASLPEHNDPGDDRGHEGDAGERQGHVHGVPAPHLNAAHGVALNGGEKSL